MMIGLLADAAASDPMISGNWLIGIIGALSTAVAAIIGKVAGHKAEASNREVTVKKPVPTIQVREEAQWATKPELEDHVETTREEFARVWNQFGVERKIGNEESTKIHERLNKQSEATATLQGSVNEVGKNVARILDVMMNRKPGARQ